MWRERIDGPLQRGGRQHWPWVQRHWRWRRGQKKSLRWSSSCGSGLCDKKGDDANAMDRSLRSLSQYGISWLRIYQPIRLYYRFWPCNFVHGNACTCDRGGKHWPLMPPLTSSPNTFVHQSLSMAITNMISSPRCNAIACTTAVRKGPSSGIVSAASLFIFRFRTRSLYLLKRTLLAPSLAIHDTHLYPLRSLYTTI